MNTLWIKFPDDAAFTAIPGADDKRALESVFDTGDPQSPWRAALAKVSAPFSSAPLIKWYLDAPYFNAGALAAAASGGAMVVRRLPDGGYDFGLRPGLWPFFALLRAQWRITRFRAAADALPDSLALSLALGIVMQSHLIRMGTHAAHLAAYLATPDETPPHLRALVTDIQVLQMRRTALSPLWAAIIPADTAPFAAALPDYFWDDDEPAAPVTAPTIASGGPWKGVPVCAGRVTGRAVAVDHNTSLDDIAALRARIDDSIILIFRAARPHSVEFFPYAQGVLFCAGGALSHACTVARDRNLPCVTALGDGLWAVAAEGGVVHLSFDGAAGTVIIVPVLP